MLRLGCVAYLNARPLIHGLADRPGEWTLELQTPSRLAARLAAGRLDVALVSSIEALRRPAYRILPGLAIGSENKMWSILLLLKKRRRWSAPLRLGLDPASETTNALLRILRWEEGLGAEYVLPRKDEDPAAREDLDGFVKIGDAALAFKSPGFRRLDLAARWHARTGLPFVFAVWQARPEVPEARLAGLTRRLKRARASGLGHVAEIAGRHGREAGLTPGRARAYLTRVVKYYLGPRERRALEAFGERLFSAGLLPARPTLRFAGG